MLKIYRKKIAESIVQTCIHFRFDHPYPTTKILWIPDTKGVCPDLLATSGDYLRIWKVNEGSGEVKLESLLNNKE